MSTFTRALPSGLLPPLPVWLLRSIAKDVILWRTAVRSAYAFRGRSAAEKEIGFCLLCLTGRQLSACDADGGRLRLYAVTVAIGREFDRLVEAELADLRARSAKRVLPTAEPMADDVWSAIGKARVMFWDCPDHLDAPDRPSPCVEWRGSVAHCLHAGCLRTSENTTPADYADPAARSCSGCIGEKNGPDDHTPAECPYRPRAEAPGPDCYGAEAPACPDCTAGVVRVPGTTCATFDCASCDGTGSVLPAGTRVP